MRIGYEADNYLTRRLIIGKVPGLEYVPIPDIEQIVDRAASLGNRVLRRLGGSLTIDSAARLRPFRPYHAKADAFHLFNRLSFTQSPWVSTFETILPRMRRTLSLHHGPNPGFSGLQGEHAILRALDSMAAKSCKRLIAMSKCNLLMQEEMLGGFPSYKDRIQPKLMHLAPPQEPLVDDFEAKGVSLEEPIRFTFVGALFFRKGGLEVLRAFSRLRRERSDFRLTIVSSLAIDEFAAKETEEPVRLAKQVIDKSGWIDHYPGLPNSETLQIMRRSHVGLLPTYADTYGFSALELQAAGCPVISTDVRALPEVNDDEVGWLIRVRKNRVGEAIYTTVEERRTLSTSIEDGLVACARRVLEDKESILLKARAAMERIRTRHSVQVYCQRLMSVYESAILDGS